MFFKVVVDIGVGNFEWEVIFLFLVIVFVFKVECMIVDIWFVVEVFEVEEIVDIFEKKNYIYLYYIIVKKRNKL